MACNIEVPWNCIKFSRCTKLFTCNIRPSDKLREHVLKGDNYDGN